MTTGPFDELLCELYAKQEIAVDFLPYTAEFDDIHAEFTIRTKRSWTRHGVWCELMRLRKQMKLPRKSKKEIKTKKPPAREKLKPTGGFFS